MYAGQTIFTTSSPEADANQTEYYSLK